MNVAAMTPMPQVMPMAAAPNAEIMPTMNSTPNWSQALAAMLGVLDDYLPNAVGALPKPSVSVASAEERTVGVGNRRGAERRGAFGVVELKGLRLDALVRFQLWATTPDEAETAWTALNAKLLADREKLQIAGFLRFALASASAVEPMLSASLWRKYSDYHVLFEYRYHDSDGAESLIARIPIHSDPEARNSPQRETTTVTDEMVRWDNEAAPRLIVRGRLTIGNLSALAFVPATAPAGTVILKRTFDGAVGALASFSTLEDFLNNVGGATPAMRHAQVSFASINAFLDAFKPAGDAIELGDWNSDKVPDAYKASTLALARTIELLNVTDRLELIYQNPAFDQKAVVYLRAKR